MEILKRPSGGRGEYEIAGTEDSLAPADLSGLEMVISCGASGALRTGLVLKVQGGKCRLRLGNDAHLHIQRQIEVILMLPKSIREESRLQGGEPTILENRYILRRIELEDVQVEADFARLGLGNVECDNGSQHAEQIHFNKRVARIYRLHNEAAKFPQEIAQILVQHRELLQVGTPLRRDAENLVVKLMRQVSDTAADYDVDYIYGTDVVPTLEEILRLPVYETPPAIEDIDPVDVELRRREANKWRRWAAHRGAPAAKFRRDVREAYNSTCVVCGLHLPRSKVCSVAGVDAAHVLPWAEYDLDVIANGLCLCKLHHWAFDQLLIAISRSNDEVRVRVTSIAEFAFREVPHSLAALKSVEGLVPRERLPASKKDWPRSQYLERLYEGLELNDTEGPNLPMSS